MDLRADICLLDNGTILVKIKARLQISIDDGGGDGFNGFNCLYLSYAMAVKNAHNKL